MPGLLLATQVGTGFLHHLFPTRGSLMLDIVCIAMVAVIPVMGIGIQLAKKKKYQQHKTVMIILCAALFATVVAFEVDMQIYTKWRELAAPSPYYESGMVFWSLVIHLCFSVPSLLLWIVLITRALKNFDNPPSPNHHSRWHRRWGMIGAYFMTGTAVTGWIFYYLACVA